MMDEKYFVNAIMKQARMILRIVEDHVKEVNELRDENEKLKERAKAFATAIDFPLTQKYQQLQKERDKLKEENSKLLAHLKYRTDRQVGAQYFMSRENYLKNLRLRP